jgi:hypothetical protein
MRPAIVVAVLLVATTALGQSAFAPPPEPAPDYSRETLLDLFADMPEREDPDARFRHEFGAIDFRAFGIRWRVGYLPFFMPLSGSQPWVNGQRWPDPFVLTGTQLATTPRSFRRGRAMNAELRRIERKVKESAKVTVTPE